MTLSTSAKLLAAGGLVVAGGAIVVAAEMSGFIAGIAVSQWWEESNPKRPRYMSYNYSRPTRPLMETEHES